MIGTSSKIVQLITFLKKHSFFSKSLVSIVLLYLAGCAGDTQDLEEYVETTQKKYIGSVEPLPEFVPYQNYVYDAFDYRDPFLNKSDRDTTTEQPITDGLRPDTQRTKEPLEFFPLDSLKMAGTMEKNSEVWGLIQDPEGNIHRVKPGQHAGENFGEIIRISESKIELLEIIQDGLGGWIEREVALSVGEE